jgi:hypothetical protein
MPSLAAPLLSPLTCSFNHGSFNHGSFIGFLQAPRAAGVAPGARGFTVPSGTPISSATSATGRPSSYIKRHTSRSGQPGGPNAAAAATSRSVLVTAASAGSLTGLPSSSRASSSRAWVAGPRFRSSRAAWFRAITQSQAAGVPRGW